VFTFGVFSLFFGLLKERGVIVDPILVKRFAYLMLIACFPAYFLSTLWAYPGLVFNIIGLLAALLQLVALVYLIKIVKVIPTSFIKNFTLPVRILFLVAVISFLLKLILQTLSAHPQIAQLAYEVRNYVMAYLHLVLIGMISSFLLAWSMEKGWLDKHATISVVCFTGGFIGMEVMLVVSSLFTGLILESASVLMFFSSIMLAGLLLILYKTFFSANKSPH
jgi:hypothetical protein